LAVSAFTQEEIMSSSRSDFWNAAATASAGLIWLLAFFASRGAIEVLPLSAGWRVAVALAPLAPFLVFLWRVIAATRGMDELQRRIQLEALAVAFLLSVVLLMTLGLLQLAIELPAEDWSFRHIWFLLPAFYFAGLAFAWRRYR
jgi:hypothetical protein